MITDTINSLEQRLKDINQSAVVGFSQRIPTLRAELAALEAAYQAQIAAGQVALAEAQAEYDVLYQRIVDRYGELAPLPWPFDGWAWDESFAGTTVDLTGYVETFRDDFNDTSTIGRKDADPATVKWFTGARTNFGEAAFMQIGDYYDPYSSVDGDLKITMVQLSSTTTPPLPPNTNPYKSGLIQTVNANGDGWAQAGGYFEAEMLFPVGDPANSYKINGAWPAFWLLTNDKKNPVENTRMEFDIMEAYGSDPEGFHATVHYKPAGVLAPGAYPARKEASNYVGLDKVKNLVGDQSLIWGTNGNMFNGIRRTYAVKFGNNTTEPTQVFIDGIEVCRCPTLDWMIASPVYMLVNLARLNENPTPVPQVMSVGYVRAMAKL